MAKLNAPAQFDFASNNFSGWAKTFKMYRLASKLNKEEGEVQVATLIYTMGKEAEVIYDSFTFEQEQDKNDYEKVMEKFTNYFEPKKNIIHLRSIFHSRCQSPQETSENYIRELYRLSEDTEFHDRKEQIRDRLVVGILDRELSTKLQLEADLTLDKAITMIRQTEGVKSAINKQGENLHADAIKQSKSSYGSRSTSSKYGHKTSNHMPNHTHTDSDETCKRCGRRHPPRKCPAFKAKCHQCGKMGHFAKLCLTKPKEAKHPPTRRTTEVSQNPITYFCDIIEGNKQFVTDNQSPWYVNLTIDSSQSQFKVDTGADVTVMTEKSFYCLTSKPKINRTDIDLMSANSAMKVVGYCYLDVLYKNNVYNLKVYVAKCHCNLLSRSAANNMFILQRVDSLGVVKGVTAHIKMLSDIKPVAVHAPRRIPFPLLSKVNAELDRMIEDDVIRPITEPTDWCSNILPVEKPNGSVRICVDLRAVNRAVRREYYPIPNFDDLATKFRGASVFTSLDARSGYHQISLDAESQKVTTFITHRGRYCFNRLPFGITSASEIFQRIMENTLGDMEGVVIYQDDIVVCGKSMSQHDERLNKVLERIRNAGIELNDAKCHFRQPSIKFLGHIFNEKGVSVDKAKVRAIKAMCEPTDQSSLRRLLGAINYLQRFIPNLSKIAAPLNELLKKDVVYVWGDKQRIAVGKIVEQLQEDKSLEYYNPQCPVVITADASTSGIGAVLSQADKCITFASRTLTESERKYSNIERELLGLVWACEKYDQYIRGLQQFTLQTDHKPLVPMINGSDISRVPLRCQRLLMRLMRYNPKAEYVPGNKMYLSDALSRNPTEFPTVSEINFATEIDAYADSVMKNLPISHPKLSEIRAASQQDYVIKKAMKYTIDGWPQRIHEVEEEVRHLYSHRGSFSVAENVLLHQSRIVIPMTMRGTLLASIHDGHWGIDKCRERARQLVWWPGISKDIARYSQECDHCNKNANANKREPMIINEAPPTKWFRISTDLLTYQNKNYIVVFDQHSKYLELLYLSSTTSQAVIQKLVSIFNRWGFPYELMSDNGPQYQSDEFQKFVEQHDIRHVTSSPRYPQSNGAAEMAVQLAKKILRAEDPNVALMAYRSAKTQTGYSPNEAMLGRQVRTNIPCHETALKDIPVDDEDIRQANQQAKYIAKQYYDRHATAKPLPDLPEGSPVRMRKDGEWTVKEYNVHGKANTPRSYVISDPDTGRMFRRNRRQLLASSDQTHNDQQPLQNDSNIRTLRPRGELKPPMRFDDYDMKR